MKSFNKIAFIKMNQFFMVEISYNSKEICIHKKNGLNSDFFIGTTYFYFNFNFGLNKITKIV